MYPMNFTFSVYVFRSFNMGEYTFKLLSNCLGRRVQYCMNGPQTNNLRLHTVRKGEAIVQPPQYFFLAHGLPSASGNPLHSRFATYKMQHVRIASHNYVGASS